MTKQEEIREGIAEVVKSVTGCNDWKAREVAVKVTEKEASQGCVIKVDRPIYRVTGIQDLIVPIEIKIMHELKKAYKEAGYVAVEPLIEVG